MECPLCKSDATRPHYRLRGYTVAICDTCRFQFNADFQGGGDAGELFSEEYYCGRHRDAFEAQFADYRQDLSADVFIQRLEQIESMIAPGRVLDVGCALGSFLCLARDRGWQAEGVEVSRFAADFATQRRDLKVFCGQLADYEAEDASFDLITFWDSIEHVATPREDMEQACRLLRPGGLMLFTTDNFDCLIADVGRVMYRMSGGRIKYGVQRVFIDANLAYFTEQSFRGLLQQVGLKPRVFEKMEYPLDKIKTNQAERMLLRGFYLAGSLLGRQAQFTVIAQKAS
jgi:SAM-dependent methyltransferase